VARRTGLREVGPEHAAEEREPRQADDAGERQEYAQRLVHRVDPQDRADRAADVLERRSEEVRLAGLRVGRDRDMGDGEVALACLDQGLECVTEARDDDHAQGGLAAVRAEA
jgi:hypothetical protein